MATKGFDLMTENCQPFLQGFGEKESSTGDQNVNKGRGRLFDLESHGGRHSY